MTAYIASVVEGQTEQEGCFERLLQRVWNELLCRAERLQVVEPFRSNRDQLVHANGKVLTDSTRKAFLKLHACSKKDPEARRLVLILLDAEKDCPAILGPQLLDVARKALPTGFPVSCVLAKRMLENWIVAGASTHAGENGLPEPLPSRDQIEERSGSTWLETQLRSVTPTRKYKKTVDAKVFVQRMAMSECRANAPSFDKLCRELEAQLPRRSTDMDPADHAVPPPPEAETDP